ncbi:perlucin-like protein [Patiria miniata]|uniref:C-type lectin domain-containing protein n=1 Tax=Patiria miniata TaxID=46514 RepID=A0A913Z4Q5_PATMI|nr:perlucin-like protein [Patiria miniata]
MTDDLDVIRVPVIVANCPPGRITEDLYASAGGVRTIANQPNRTFAAQNGIVKCGGSWQQLGEKCFLAVAGSNRDWKDARSDCQTRAGTDLAVIPDQATTTFLQSMLAGVTSQYWVGLHDLPNENDFRWVDGQSLIDTNYTNWAPNQPNNGWLFSEDCVTFKPSNGKWNDAACDFGTRPYICERNSCK